MRIFHVDAFTDVPFRGNPAVVCLVEGALTDEWMQSFAAEMNVSETAFVAEVAGRWSLRWFTPAVEVDLCGHATLASAHVLWEVGLGGRQVVFETRSGLLAAERAADEVSIELDFPEDPPVSVAEPAGLAAALGLGAPPLWVGRGRFDYLVVVREGGVVRGLRPDLAALAQFDVRAVVVTAEGDDGGADFVSRVFGPRTGVPEDPVTGSAHCMLGPFWGERLGKDELIGYQASARGGWVGVRLAGDRVVLSGQAVTIARGEVA